MKVWWKHFKYWCWSHLVFCNTKMCLLIRHTILENFILSPKIYQLKSNVSGFLIFTTFSLVTGNTAQSYQINITLCLNKLTKLKVFVFEITCLHKTFTFYMFSQYIFIYHYASYGKPLDYVDFYKNFLRKLTIFLV